MKPFSLRRTETRAEHAFEQTNRAVGLFFCYDGYFLTIEIENKYDIMIIL